MLFKLIVSIPFILGLLGTPCLAQDQPKILPEEKQALASMEVDNRWRSLCVVNDTGNVIALKFIVGGHDFRNDVTDQQLSALSKLPELQSLNFRGCYQLTDAGLRHVAKLKKLKSLDFASLGINGAGLVHFVDSKALKSLDLSRTGLIDASLKHLGSLHGLEALNLSHTKITDAGFRQCENLSELRSLNLANTSVTDAGLSHLKNMTKLESLILPPLATDRCLGVLKSMTGLKEIAVSGEFDSKYPERITLMAVVNLFESQGRTIAEAFSATKTVHRVNDQGEVIMLDMLFRYEDRPRLTDEFLGLCNRLEQLETLSVLVGSPTSIPDGGVSRLDTNSNLSKIKVIFTERSADDLSHLGKIKSLRSVELVGAVTDDLIAHLVKLPGLESLTLSGSSVTNNCLKHLRGLPKLSCLQLTRPGISDDGLPFIAEITSLRELVIRDSKLTGQGLVHLGRLNQLTKLDVQGAQVDDTDLRHIKNLTQLMTFSTAGTNITSLARLKFFRDIQQRAPVDVMVIEGAQLKRNATGQITHVFFNGHQDNGRITDEHLSLVSTLEQLEELKLYRQDVTSAGIKHLRNIVSLKTLNLYRCEKLDDAALSHLVKLSALESLVLYGNEITDAGLRHLAKLKYLEYLSIRNSKVTGEGREWLAKELPGCRIR